jgi:catechol 2,3-dioxygenase-like lactoylglutathione lyase family enzyme
MSGQRDSSIREAVMKVSLLHHVSIVTANLELSAKFYCDMFGLQQVSRPPFKVGGAWFAVGPTQIHLVANSDGTFRSKSTIDTDDTHFAIRVEDFEATMRHLAAKGFREDVAEDDPMRLLVIRNGAAGFPQAYLLDPDRHVVEINAVA